MRNISEQELKAILDKHAKWLKNEEGGERANLTNANLSNANLSDANLLCANLSYANLSYANLSYANLSNANLSNANIIIFQFQKHQAFFTFDGTLRIGCHVLPISEWHDTFKEIGKEEKYTHLEIEMYGNFIKMCYNKFKNGSLN